MSDRQDDAHQRHHHGRGPSSYWMHDPNTVFGALGLSPGETFLDMGCGPGDYAIAAAGIVGTSGRVIAIDRSSRMIDALSARGGDEGVTNMRTMTADITAPLPVGDGSVDVCLISTVLHILGLGRVGRQVFVEMRRILGPGGRASVIECKKEERPFGPPLERRLSPEDVSDAAEKAGLVRSSYIDLGHNYMVVFARGVASQGARAQEKGR